MSVRQLPANIEAERTVLGACIRDRYAITTAQEMLRPSDFSAPAHRIIYSALCDLIEDEQHVDLITLRAALLGRSQLEQVGGIAYVSGLGDGLPRITNLDQWCLLIIEQSLRRALIRQAESAMNAAFDSSQKIAVTLDSYHSALLKLMESREGGNDISQGEALKAAQDRLDRYAMSAGVTGVPCGLEKLDRVTSGWQPGQLIIVAARPAVGKSTLCTQMAAFAGKAGFPVRMFTLEMSAAAVAERSLLAEARVEKWHLRRGDKDWPLLANAYGKLSRLPITYDRRESPTAMQIRAACRRQQLTGDLKLVIVDYLQRVSYDESIGENAERIGIGRAAKSLKSLALGLNVPVVVACQLRRAAEKNTEPTLADLAKSGDIECEADVVIALHPDPSTRAKELDFPLTHLLMLKHREGACRRIRLTFEKRFTTFVEEQPRAAEGGTDAA